MARRDRAVNPAIIGVGAESHEYAAASALVCLHPSGTNSALYHTVSLVGLNQTHSLAHTWLLDSDKQIKRYLHRQSEKKVRSVPVPVIIWMVVTPIPVF